MLVRRPLLLPDKSDRVIGEPSRVCRSNRPGGCCRRAQFNHLYRQQTAGSRFNRATLVQMGTGMGTAIDRVLHERTNAMTTTTMMMQTTQRGAGLRCFHRVSGSTSTPLTCLRHHRHLLGPQAFQLPRPRPTMPPPLLLRLPQIDLEYTCLYSCMCLQGSTCRKRPSISFRSIYHYQSRASIDSCQRTGSQLTSFETLQKLGYTSWTNDLMPLPRRTGLCTE